MADLSVSGDEVATKTFWLTMAGSAAFIGSVFLFIL